jgi:hypothetical protein
MENVAGEDLGWFWRSWIQNNWKLDQAISSVKYVDNSYTKGAVITIRIGKNANACRFENSV